MFKLLLAIAVVFVVGSSIAWPNGADTLATNDTLTTGDPASNRLFLMSTGRVSKPQHLWIGVFEFIALQLGYAPTDYLQITLLGTGGYFSAGVKARLLGEWGIFKGLALGADLGYFPYNPPPSARIPKSFSAAATVGFSGIEGHLSFSSASRGFNPQVGFSALLAGGGEAPYLKVVGEWWNHSEIEGVSFRMLGLRIYTDRFAAELAALYFPQFCFGHCSEQTSFSFFPYLSLMWFFADH